MPLVPIEMPSLTPMVLNRMPTMPAACTPSFTLRGEVAEVHVAGVAVVPHGGDADLRLLHVVVGQARAVEHGLDGALGLGLRDVGGVFVEHGEEAGVSGSVVSCWEATTSDSSLERRESRGSVR